MNLNLSQKERMLLEDQKTHEQLCIEKYTNFAHEASDAELKQMFLNHASQEQEHLNSINQMLNGQIPDLNQNQQSSQNNQNQMNNQPQNVQQAGMVNQTDEKLCEDLLMTEKYVSNTYDTSIFEFKDSNARDVLNHIQKEEQQHGEHISNYMINHGMYTVQ
ncbi:spore coat protein [Haloimpatiens myeolchijeotgali]|uniref:spore coat protein n=1 Tax=Haloimpatiens sp. FM7330 TaxID=3298610 RepID=UPI00384D1E2E